MATAGRWRATIRAVWPDDVVHTIALASTSEASSTAEQVTESVTTSMTPISGPRCGRRSVGPARRRDSIRWASAFIAMRDIARTASIG